MRPVIRPSTSLTWQLEDLVQSHAVVQRRGNYALCPEAPGPQVVHADTRSHRVVTGPDPVVGCRGDDETNPARAACKTARQLPA